MALLMFVAAAFAVCPSRLPEVEHGDVRVSDRVILVVKDERVLGIYENGLLVEGDCFSVTMGSASQDGPKQKRGDMRTPEGWYTIDHRNPGSRFYKSLAITYPNFDDVMRGVEGGVIDHEVGNKLTKAINRGTLPQQNTALGGDIFLHGNPGAWTNDWTWGCVSLQNVDMDTLYRLADPGTAVLIVPTLAHTQRATR